MFPPTSSRRPSARSRTRDYWADPRRSATPGLNSGRRKGCCWRKKAKLARRARDVCPKKTRRGPSTGKHGLQLNGAWSCGDLWCGLRVNLHLSKKIKMGKLEIAKPPRLD